MGLLDDLEAASAQRRPTQCSVCQWLTTQPDAEIWGQAFDAPKERITTAAIFAEMRRRGFTRTVQTADRHRKGDCGWRT